MPILLTATHVFGSINVAHSRIGGRQREEQRSIRFRDTVSNDDYLDILYRLPQGGS
jgi:hypothetical protein